VSLSRKSIALLLLPIFLSGCEGLFERPPEFEIALAGPRAEGDSIKVSGSATEVLFSVRSEFGIGRATIRPSRGDWPEKITFHFALKGLEGLEISGEQVFRKEFRDDHRSGGYRVELPRGVAGNGNQSIEISWVDFYR